MSRILALEVMMAALRVSNNHEGENGNLEQSTPSDGWISTNASIKDILRSIKRKKILIPDQSPIVVFIEDNKTTAFDVVLQTAWLKDIKNPNHFALFEESKTKCLNWMHPSVHLDADSLRNTVLVFRKKFSNLSREERTSDQALGLAFRQFREKYLNDCFQYDAEMVTRLCVFQIQALNSSNVFHDDSELSRSIIECIPKGYGCARVTVFQAADLEML